MFLMPSTTRLRNYTYAAWFVAGNLFVKMKPPNNKIWLLSAKISPFHGIDGHIATALDFWQKVPAAPFTRLNCATATA
jgi:hypothetical protein